MLRRLYLYPEEGIPSGIAVHQDSVSRRIPLFIMSVTSQIPRKSDPESKENQPSQCLKQRCYALY